MTTLPQPNNEGAERKLGDVAARGHAVLAEALRLSQSGGARVFPVHGVREVAVPAGFELRCTCGNVACHNPGKHPVGSLCPNGHNNATRNRETVAAWFAVRDGAGWVPWNLGVATGLGLVVVDADVKQPNPELPTGLEVLDDWETWTGGTSLPKTKVVRTGSGGLHVWLNVDANLKISARNRVLPGIDVKGDGGYVLASPSVHVSGGRYEVVEDVPVAGAGSELVAWLLAVKGGRYIQRRAADGAAAIPDDYDFTRIVAGDGCPAGHRDYFANDLAFRLRRRGLAIEDAAATARREWLRMEQPPGDEFSWDALLYKLRRVWDEVQPEDVTDLPAWRPPGSGAEVAPVVDTGQAPGEVLREAEAPGISVRELLDRPELTFQLSDTGNAERFAQRMRDVVRFSAGEGRWYVWDDGRWRTDDLNVTLHWTTEIVKDLYVEAAREADEDTRVQIGNWAKATQSAGHREAMLHLASSQPGIALSVDALDADPWLLVVKNGTLDLRTGTLRASLPEDLCTRRAEVALDPGAGCPLWEKHIEFVTRGDKMLAEYVRRAIGYSLTGLTSEQKVFFLWGTGQNGKSTFVDVLAKLLGDYATQGDESLLTGSGGHPTQLADLRGVRLVVCDETDREKKLAEQRIKMMTGKTIKARYMRKDFFSFTPRFKIWISGNHKPEIRGTDQGIWRRLKLVPFTAALTDDNRILDYDDILAAELPGILNWALEGLAQWREQGQLGEAETVRQATREYRDEEDVVGLWLADSARVGVAGAFADNGKVYDSYRWWCTSNGVEKIVSNVVLGRDLAGRGFTRDSRRVGSKTCRGWLGIEIGDGESTDL